MEKKQRLVSSTDAQRGRVGFPRPDSTSTGGWSQRIIGLRATGVPSVHHTRISGPDDLGSVTTSCAVSEVVPVQPMTPTELAARSNERKR